jgi:hypothetical protein
MNPASLPTCLHEDLVSLLKCSGQRWKIFLFITLMGLGAVVTLFQGFLYGPLGQDLTVRLVVGAMFLIITTFVWAGQSIVCPQCHLKLLYHAIIKVGFASWYVWLLTAEQCPKCRYSGQTIPTTGRRGQGRGGQ